jgi:DNA-binding response OmpR family regulator
MSDAIFCPYCRAAQPEREPPDGNLSREFCYACGYPLEAGRDAASLSGGATILWIDDDRLLLSFCCDALQRQGYRVIVAADGPTGIEAAKSERPDLILLDVVMPNMGGLEVCRRLRVEPELRETPIILLTVLQGPNIIAKGREAGATSTISKPFGPEHIISVIKRILGRRSDLAGA